MNTLIIVALISIVAVFVAISAAIMVAPVTNRKQIAVASFVAEQKKAEKIALHKAIYALQEKQNWTVEDCNEANELAKLVGKDVAILFNDGATW